MTLGRAGQPWVEPADPSSPTYLHTKVKAFNAIANHFLPMWLQHRQHESSTGVKSCFLLPIPGWAVKTYHCTRHAGYCSTIDTPSRHNTTTIVSWDFWGTALSIPRQPPSPTSRPGLDQSPVNKRTMPTRPLATRPRVFHCPIPNVTMVPRGWPAIPRARRYSNPHKRPSNLHL
jgi:hypothetical protein